MFAPDAKILIIEDHVTLRKMIKQMVKDLGYTNVEDTDNGKTALEILSRAQSSSQPFQLVISDWNMPKMSGLNLLKSCRDNPIMKDLPFMLITGEVGEAYIAEAVKYKVSDFIVKPFTAQTLEEKIVRIYAKHFNSKAS